MRDEINNYGINNPDGGSQAYHDAKRQVFDNDKASFIKENSLSEQPEVSDIPERFDEPTGGFSSEEQAVEVDLSSELSSASSSMASASASVGGGLGALAGAVAAGVVTAVVVVAVFLSTLMINLSLVMAGMHELILEVKMTGAQEEDFATPIYAILTGEDDVYQEQIIEADTLMLSFGDLQPGTRYHVTVKNEEKVFFESDYFTSTTPSEKGEIEARLDGNDVFVLVKNLSLKSTEHYTIVAKDASGDSLYQADGIDPIEYHFTVDTPKNIYFFLNVGGKTYATCAVELPEYDYENGVWEWADDYTAAKVTFADKKGGEALVLNATITRKATEQPTCDKEGTAVYTAKAGYDGKTFSDKKTIILDALLHDYEGTSWPLFWAISSMENS